MLSRGRRSAPAAFLSSALVTGLCGAVGLAQPARALPPSAETKRERVLGEALSGLGAWSPGG